PSIRQDLITHIEQVFPQQLATGNILEPALNTLSKNASFLLIFAVLVAIFVGSRLFISIENYFYIIYHTRPLYVFRQYIMSLPIIVVSLMINREMSESFCSKHPDYLLIQLCHIASRNRDQRLLSRENTCHT